MNDLIAAAKAIIRVYDTHGINYVRGTDIMSLRAAVERAEKQKVDFDNWWNQTEIWPSEYTAAASAWTAAQQAERERLRQKVAEIIRLEDFDDVMDVFRD